MTILLVLAHPNEQSFNYAIADTARRTLEDLDHQVIFRDLYCDGFDPLLWQDEFPTKAPLPPLVEEYCTELAAADGLIIVHPNWWGMPPAIMKGWVDRVFRPGVAYEFLEGDKGEGIPLGLLKAQSALVFNTCNTPAEREQEVFGDPLERLWQVCILDFCGIKDFERRMFGMMVLSDAEQRQGWLDEVARMVARRFPAQE